MGSPLDAIWAKSPNKGQSRGESLRSHTERVVAALVQLMTLRSELTAMIQCPQLWHRAYWACCLHDLGKVATGFQSQLRSEGAPWGKRHEVLSLTFLPWIGMGESDLVWVAAAIASHHRDASVIEEKYPPNLDPEYSALPAMLGEVPAESVDVLYGWLANWANRYIAEQSLGRFGVVGLEFQGNSPGVLSAATIGALLAEYQRLVRRLRDAPESSRDVLAGLVLRGVVVMADRLGSAHAPPLAAVGLAGPQAVMQTMKKARGELYRHQRRAAGAKSDVLLVAPTGSGKTEAALLWAASGARRGAPRLFYLLPYQASINAMYRRLSDFLPRRVGLQHGRSLHALYRRLLEEEPNPKRAAAIALREKGLVDLNHPPVRVLTPYQLLKACYRLRGYEAILTDLVAASIVIDEVHAYEPCRLAMILGMARYLKQNLATNWFVMSATLPTIVRTVVDEALEHPHAILASEETFSRFCRHSIRMVDGDVRDSSNLDRIVAAAGSGPVLVCCNTVSKAQKVRDDLAGRLPVGAECPVHLLHGRFNARDRNRKEQVVIDTVSPGSRADRRPLILVATQVVEVSLNLSFDTIFTEPAPLDALLQRFGRVNRLPGGKLCPVHVFRLPTDGQHVYKAALVQRTLDTLERRNGAPVDEAETSRWLDEIFSGRVAEDWKAEYTRQSREFEDATLRRLAPFQSDDRLQDDFYKAFDAVEVLPSCLEAQFDAENLGNPIQAGELVLSVPHYTLAKLPQAPRQRADWIRVVDAPYDFDSGLQLDDS